MNSDGTDAPLTIGIDLGTQSVSVVLVHTGGTVARSGNAPPPNETSGDARHEQDPEDWWEAVGRAAREVAGDFGDGDVGGMAVCSVEVRSNQTDP